MNKPVFVRTRAEDDLQEARRWYEEQRQGLGDEFLLEVGRAFGALEEHAELRPPYYRDFHRSLTPRFPYKIFYRIEGHRVVVFRVLHAKRDHPRWL